MTNCKLLRDGQLVDDDLWVDTEAGTVIDPIPLFYGSTTSSECRCEKVLDAEGCLVAPGFIDIQLNGAFGVDFSSVEQVSEDRDAIQRVAKKLLETGVTSFCPTLISLKPEEYKTLIPLFEETDGRETGSASILGLHLEGPFFSKEKIGAHPLENIKVPNQQPIEEIYGGDLSRIRIFTLAPELPGALDVITHVLSLPFLSRIGGRRVVSIGHSSATLEEARAGVKCGATMITHLFNAMGAFHHRDPGIIGLLGDFKQHDTIKYGVIADGIHAAPNSVAMAFQSHPIGMVLVTDAMSAMGLPVGMHRLGAQHIDVQEFLPNKKRAVVAGTETLAGSVISIDDCVRNMIEFTACGVEKALEAASVQPAKALGLDSIIGTLNFGAHADFVLLDPVTLVVKATFLKGMRAYVKEEGSFSPQLVPDDHSSDS